LKENINGTEYELRVLTRGQVREIEAEADGSDQADLLVQLTCGQDTVIDDLPMPDYVAISQWAVRTNGLDGTAIDAAKKN
jgi:hypothetical protein